LLENYSGIRTTNADKVRASLFDELGATYFNLPNGSENFSINLRWCKRDNITLVNSVCRDATEVEYSASTFVRQYFELDPAARFRFDLGRRSQELSCSSPPVVVPSNMPFRVESAACHNIVVLRIEQHFLNRQMEYMLGNHIAGEVDFEQPTDTISPKQQLMRRAVIEFIAELDVLGSTIPRLARIELEQSLVTRFLLCNEHNFSQRLSARDAAPSLSQLRLVEDYLEVNWDKPFNMEALVENTNVSARTIFRHFKNVRGVSPRDFVKAIRLRHVRRLLQSAAPDASVMAIAMNCGFQSLGHFSREYRRAFGERPSETLNRTRSSARP
jgi:AraC-like DNA-binding protein